MERQISQYSLAGYGPYPLKVLSQSGQYAGHFVSVARLATGHLVATVRRHKTMDLQFTELDGQLTATTGQYAGKRLATLVRTVGRHKLPALTFEDELGGGGEAYDESFKHSADGILEARGSTSGFYVCPIDSLAGASNIVAYYGSRMVPNTQLGCTPVLVTHRFSIV